ncbi:MAG: hypothetical protein R6V85_17660 [Polyangia bacterium]
MRIFTRIATLPLAALLAACGGDEESGKRPAEKEPAAAAKEPDLSADEPERPASDRKAPSPAEPARAGAEVLDRLPKPPPDHEKTGAEDRAALAELYVTFAQSPEKFVERARALSDERRRQLAGYLFCAAPKLSAAGAPGSAAGAPRELDLPPGTSDLIAFGGSEKHKRQMFLQQLAGEFLVLGRCLQSLDEDGGETIEKVMRRQGRNLRMMKATRGADEVAAWEERIEKVFPELLAGLIPEC